jgi:hypothetical protein
MVRSVTAIRSHDLEPFLSAWFGPPVDDPVAAPDRPHDSVPAALREFYRLTSRWPGLFK